MESLKILKQISQYCSLIHSSPGRLRVRVSPTIMELKNSIDFSQINNIIAKIDGIDSVKFNKLIGSITIEYDNDKFPQSLWHDILNGENLELISKKMDAIKAKIDAI